MPVVTLTAINSVQQSAIASAFGSAGWSMQGTSRSAGPGLHSADLESGAGLAAAFRGSDVVVFTLPQDHRPGVTRRMASAVTQAAAEAGVGHLILNMATRLDDTATAPVFQILRDVGETVRSGLTPATVIEPTVFMDNLLARWSLPALATGRLAYPMQPDTAVAWMSHRTLAAAVVAAAGLPAGQIYRIGGCPITLEQMADTLATRLGHPVSCSSVPLDDFAAGLNASFGPPAGDRIAELYANLAARPDAMIQGNADLSRLGVAPEPFIDFVARNAWGVAAQAEQGSK